MAIPLQNLVSGRGRYGVKKMFEREDRYLVIKRSDLEKLCIDDIEAVYEAAEIIAQDRARQGKLPLQCVVVESDWPEYEKVWAMIQERVEGETS